MAVSKLNPSAGGIPFGNNAGRPAGAIGKLYSNGEAQRLELYTATGWNNIIQEVPGVSSISGSYSQQTDSGVINIYGTNFVDGAYATAIGSNGVQINAASTSFNSLVQLTATFTGLSNAYEPYDIKVTNPSNLFGLIPDALYINASPVWQTASGSLGTFNEQVSISLSAAATDSDSTISYALASGSTLPSGVTLNSSTGLISGTLPDILSNTTYTFTINASDGLNTIPRTFSITSLYQVNAEVLVVAGGGGGSSIIGGGGGAGGVIFNSNVILNPSIPILVTVGAGGRGAFGYTGGKDTEAGYPGYDSVLGSFTAFGGGGTYGWDTNATPALSGNRPFTKNGGSGGGGTGGGGSTTVDGSLTSIGGSGVTGQGFAGGTGSDPYGAGGGGAGGIGHSQSIHGNLNGGDGVAHSITGSSVYYGGGGGGGRRTSGGGSGPSTGGIGGGGSGMSGSSFSSNQNGTANTGGGGGGGNYSGPSQSEKAGGDGGSGVVIIAYPNTLPAITTIPGTLTYDQPTRAGYRVYRFTAGTGTVTF
jgi:hypothetical protein